MFKSDFEVLVAYIIQFSIYFFIIILLVTGASVTTENLVNKVDKLSVDVYKDNNTVQGDLYIFKGNNVNNATYVSDVIDVIDVEITDSYVRYDTAERSIKLLTGSENAVVEYSDGIVEIIYMMQQ